ncbi:carboxymuconolactone decarboxylase family protein [Marinimicrobium sp. C2-29]|uniref:carboxymuconolactone decarboxylase family protein n=1 Tax=Marinimicrobium sp. C2-29 TaxID=3139825 RepID=UPI00313924ED
MNDFKLHDVDSAPEESKPLLKKSLDDFGMIPNLHAVMAEAPGTLEGYQKLHELVLNSSLNNDEKTVVWQTINVENQCHYCVPAHSGIARSMKVSEDIDNALRDKTPLPDDKLEALRNFTLGVVRDRGNVSEKELNAFYEAGYGHRQVLEVILTVSQKVMSNYINHIAKTPVDEPFKSFEWKAS